MFDTPFRPFAALALLACLTAPASARRGERVATIGDAVNYKKGPYLAYNAPYSAGRSGLARGADYEDATEVRPGSFPNRTRIRWRWPDGGEGVRGYLQIAYGNYDSGIPLVRVQPRQVGQIAAFTVNWSVALDGDPANSNGLVEFYCTTQPGVASTKYEEVGFFTHLSDTGLHYFNTAQLVGTYDDGVRSWTVRAIRGGSAHHYIMFYAGGAVPAAREDMRAALRWLVDKGQVDPAHWVNGAAIGVEPVRGGGAMQVARWAVSLR